MKSDNVTLNVSMKNDDEQNRWAFACAMGNSDQLRWCWFAV